MMYAYRMKLKRERERGKKQNIIELNLFEGTKNETQNKILSFLLFCIQDEPNSTEHEIEITTVTKEGCDRADRSQFELLQTLGAGSFGRVRSREKS